MNIDKGLIKHWKMLFESDEARQNGEESSLQTEENREEEEDYTFQRWKSDTKNDGKTNLDARKAINDVFEDPKTLKLIGDIFWEIIDENHQILDDVVAKLRGDAISRFVNVYGNDRESVDKLRSALAKLKNRNKSSDEIYDKWNRPTKPDEVYESNDEKNQTKELQAKLNKLDELAKKAENTGKLPDNVKDKLENLQNQIHNGKLQAESEEDGIGIGGIVTIAGVVALVDTLIDVLLGLI